MVNYEVQGCDWLKRHRGFSMSLKIEDLNKLYKSVLDFPNTIRYPSCINAKSLRVIARSPESGRRSNLKDEILRGVYPELFTEILRCAQNDRRRRAQNDIEGY